MFYENGRKISNGLFTPPAEPFLPAVDPSTPELPRPHKSSPPHQQDELEFKSFDENDDAWKNDSPATAVSNNLCVCCLDVCNFCNKKSFVSSVMIKWSLRVCYQ
jgi:hypothetical protein